MKDHVCNTSEMACGAPSTLKDVAPPCGSPSIRESDAMEATRTVQHLSTVGFWTRGTVWLMGLVVTTGPYVGQSRRTRPFQTRSNTQSGLVVRLPEIPLL